MKNIIITDNMRTVIRFIQHHRINPDFVSPNLVAEISYDLGQNLTPEQIVYISDNFK